jgi:membrane-bound lytic murein transglycosylase D
MPLADTGKFIDHEDSIYNYRASELLTKRQVVEVNDDVPTFRRSRGSYSRRSGRYSRRSARNSRRSSRASRSSRSSASSNSVTIQRGQTLSQIAKRNGTTVAKLRQLNGIKGNNIQAGKKIKVK